MKKFNLVFAFTLALGFTMKSQLLREMFNTASDPSSSYVGYRNYGLQDVAWFVAQTPYNPTATPPANPSAYVRAVSQNAAPIGWWNPHPFIIPNAGWITYPNTCPSFPPAYHGCLNDPAVTWGVDQWYKISFYLCCEEDFCIDMDMWADNRIQEVYVNTTTNSGPGYWTNPGTGTTSPGTYPGYIQSEVVSTTFCGDFHQGLNYMIIHVTSYDPGSNSDYAGLLVNTTRISECYGIIYNLLEEDKAAGEPGRAVSINDKKNLAETRGIVLNQNAPNPFAESTTITYNIPNDFSKAQILFISIDGIVIKTVDIMQKGKGSLNVFADDLSHGMYSYQLVVDGKPVDTKKMIVTEK